MGYVYDDADYVSILSDDLLKVDAQNIPSLGSVRIQYIPHLGSVRIQYILTRGSKRPFSHN